MGIEELKSNVDIVDLIGSYVKLKKEGVNHKGLCPFHAEKTPSFTVSQVRGNYKCFGCGKGGDVISFVMEYEKKPFGEAVELIAKKYGLDVSIGVKKEYIKPVPRLEKISEKALSWFEKERRISNDTLLRMRVTEAIEFMPQLKKEVQAICFNYFQKDELVNIKFRGPQKSFKLAKDAKLLFYNIDALEGEKTAIIVEGEVDTLSCVESGLFNAVGVPNGTPPVGSKMNLEYLDNCWGYFVEMERIILAGDNDEVGKNLREELARRLGKDRCWVVDYPDGCKDLNDVLVKHGKQAVNEIIELARPYPVEGIKQMEDIYPTVAEWYENGYPEGESSGVQGFDEMLRFMVGYVTTITGIPGHGKDEFLNLVMSGLSLRGWKFGMCGFEESPAETVTKLAEKITGKAFGFRKDPFYRVQPAELEKAIIHIDDHFKFFNTDEAETSVEGIIKIATQLVLRFGIKGLYVNPWNWIDHKRNENMSETEYVSWAYTQFIRFARNYGVHVFIVAHTTKLQKDKTTGKYEVPTLYSISGSANFFNKTHNGVTVYRDYSNNMVDVYVQKVKQSWLGKIGFSTYSFDTMTRQYQFVQTNINN